MLKYLLESPEYSDVEKLKIIFRVCPQNILVLWLQSIKEQLLEGVEYSGDYLECKRLAERYAFDGQYNIVYALLIDPDCPSPRELWKARLAIDFTREPELLHLQIQVLIDILSRFML